MKFIFSIQSAAISLQLLLSGCSGDDNVVTLRSSDYFQDNPDDCTPYMLQMIEDARAHPSARIIIERGTYHFYPDKAFEKYCHITNHDDGLRSTPFPVIGFKNLEIKADSAEFIFHGVMLPFIIESSENIRLSGFSIDWEIPLYSEVKVVNVNEEDHTFDIRINPDTPYEIRNGELIFLKEGYEHNLERAVCWDPSTGAVAYNTWEITPLKLREPSIVRFREALDYELPETLGTFLYRGVQNRLVAEEIMPGLVRLSGHTKKLPRPGLVIVAKGRNRYNRFAPAIRISSSKDVYIGDVTVHHAGGMGLVAEKCDNISLRRFNVALKEGSNRMLTTTADATHFNHCRGLVGIQGCLFENMLDDGTNIHGIHVIIEDILDPNTLGVSLGHFQQLGFDIAGPGDKMGFIAKDVSFFPYAECVVSTVRKINKRYYLLGFAEPLPDELNEGDLLENLDWYPEVRLINNTVRNNRARGFLIGTRGKTVCAGNTISSMDEAISLHASFGDYWYEAGFPDELVIRQNHFADCVYAGRERAVINFSCSPSQDTFLFGRVLIEGNEFNTFDPLMMNPARVDSLFILDNVISRSGTYPPLFDSNPLVEIRETGYSTFEGNRIYGFAGEEPSVDDISEKGFHMDSNSWTSR